MKLFTVISGVIVTISLAMNVSAQEAANTGMTSTGRMGNDMGVMGLSGRIYETDLGVKLKELGDAETFLKHSSELQLTDTQVSQLRRIQEDHDKLVSEQGKRLEQLEGELSNIASSDYPNLNDLKQKIRDVQEARTNRLEQEVEYIAESRAVLASTQQSPPIGLSTEHSTSPPSAPGGQFNTGDNNIGRD